MLESINLKKALLPAPPLVGPPNRHEQSGMIFPPENSALQHQLTDLLTFTNTNKMKINMKKTKIIPFNTSQKYDFLPQLYFPGSDPLEVIYEARLLGITLASNLSWQVHTNDITKRATAKLWILVRFKALGGTTSQLLKVYQTRVRSTLEFAAPVFHSGLTLEQSRQIEMVQRKAFAIILGKAYTSYKAALVKLNQERLDARRINLSLKFAEKCTKSSKHNHMFPLNPNFRPDMRCPQPFLEYTCHTSRYYNSPIPSLARLLNKQFRKSQQ